MKLKGGPVETFDKWIPRDYLKDFYVEVEPDELKTIKFEIDTFQKLVGTLDKPPLMLDYGCGPTHHHSIPASKYVSEIHMCDFTLENLEEVNRWVKNKDDKWNWNPFTRYALQCEGVENPTDEEIEQRENETRSKITRVVQSDVDKVFTKDDFGGLNRGYDLVASWYCVDSSTDDKDLWVKRMRNLAKFVNKGGLFITTALRACDYYKVGSKLFPSANVTETDLLEVLKLDFDPASITIKTEHLPEHEYLGYSGVVLAHAKKL